jgi:CRP/FNR family transcriptional regulator, cyclic AMP receptor protein
VRKTYHHGQQIQTRGDRDAGFTIVVKGKVRIGTTGRSGGFVLLGVMLPGNVFGEMTVFGGMPRVMDGTADGVTVVDFVPADKMRRLARELPDLAEALLRMMAIRQAMALDQADDVLRLPLIYRIARYLIRAHAITGANERIPVGQAELAEATASSRVSVSKSLSEMARLGLIETGYGYVRLLDAKALRAWLAAGEEVVRIRH